MVIVWFFKILFFIKFVNYIYYWIFIDSLCDLNILIDRKCKLFKYRGIYGNFYKYLGFKKKKFKKLSVLLNILVEKKLNYWYCCIFIIYF